MNRSISIAAVPRTVSERAASDAPRAAIQHALDQAYRHMVQELAREDWMQRLCAALAEAMNMTLVFLVRRQASGTLEVEASSRESALWVEMMRLPERSDGTVAGNGPAARALHKGASQTLMLEDEGFMPWREAARRDGIRAIRAVPFEVAGTSWVLVACCGRAELDALAEVGAAAVACARVLASAEQFERDRLLATALRQSGNAAFIANLQGEVVWCNAGFSRLTGYAAAEVLGRNPRFLGSGRHGLRYYRDLWNTIRSGRVWRGETVDRDRSGTAFTALQTITPFGHAGQVTHYLAVYDDITHRSNEDVRRQLRAGLDPITGLMHPAALEFHLSLMLAHGKPICVARVAARRLAAVEALGPEALDSVMDEMQQRLGMIAGPERTARLGPGDYLICLPEDDTTARQIVEDLERELREPYPLIGELPDIELRVAVVRSPQDGTDIDALLRAADRVLGVDPMDVACRQAPPMVEQDTLRGPP